MKSKIFSKNQFHFEEQFFSEENRERERKRESESEIDGNLNWPMHLTFFLRGGEP